MDTLVIETYICEKKRIEMPDLQEQFSLSYTDTVKALSELEKRGKIKYCDGLTYELSEQSRDDQESVDLTEPDEDDERARYIEMRRRELIHRLRSMDENDDDEDEDDNEEEEDGDIEKAAKERREYLEMRRQELIRHIKEQEHGKTVADLRKEIEAMPKYNAEEDTFSLKMNVSYPNEKPFKIKVIERDGCWYMSDCGNTIEYLSAVNDEEKLIDYLKQALESENICLIDNAVCTTIDDIHDLSGEGSFLFKVVDGLITQEYFDLYYLGEDLVELANEILAKNDAEMLVKALCMMDDKPIRVSALQKSLHIGYARSCRIIETLTELGIVVSDGSLTVKKDNISSGFISYLKRMLDGKNGV